MFLSSLLLALRAIRRNLMRSFLTILGIVIGVSAVITMVTLGNGATRVVSDQIASLGSNLVMVRPGSKARPRPGFGGRSPLQGRATPRRFKRRSAASTPSLPPPTGR